MGEGALDGDIFADHQNIKGSIDVFFQVGTADDTPINFDLDLVLLQKREIGNSSTRMSFRLCQNTAFILRDSNNSN